MSLTFAKPQNNYCLIKLESNDSITMDSGVVIFMPPAANQQNQEEFKPLRGTVVGLPDKLYFRQGDGHGLKWKTKMELEIGDKVILRRPALSMALDKVNGSFFTEGEDIFVYMKYDEIIVGIRGEQVIILNGFVIVEPEVLSYDTKLIVPDIAKKTSQIFGTVRFIGTPNEEYHISKNSKGEDVIQTDEVWWAHKEDGVIKIDAVELEVGDKVQFKPSTAIAIEQDMFRTLGGKDQILYRMQRFNIQAKL